LETTGVKAKVSSAAGTVSTNAKILGAAAYQKTSGVREVVGQKYTVSFSLSLELERKP